MKSHFVDSSQSLSIFPSEIASLPFYDLSTIHIQILQDKIHKTTEFLQIVTSIVHDMPKFSDWVRSQIKSNKDLAIFEFKVEIRLSENDNPIRNFNVLKRIKDFKNFERNLRNLSQTKNVVLKFDKIPKEKANDLQFVYDFYYMTLVSLFSNKIARSNFNYLYEFLGISTYSLSNKLAPIHEGPIKKKMNMLPDFCSNLFRSKTYYEYKWLIITNEGFGILDDNLSKGLSDHIVFDMNHELLVGKSSTRSTFGLNISSNSRTIKFKASNYLDFIVWVLSSQDAMKQCPHISINRFMSSFPVRNRCYCQCLFEGEEYFSSLEQAFGKAQQEIFIASAFLSPQIYLSKPVAQLLPYQKGRLDNVLKSIATKGVKIYIIIYNEPPKSHQNSQNVVTFLTELHPNISVIRCPGYNLNVSLWSFNEKLCIIDRKIGFLGGPDLCFGQWDTKRHLLTDHEYCDSQHEMTIWPGKDYTNPRIQQFSNLQEFDKTLLDRDSEPRLPTHSIGLKVEGTIVFDMSRHFIQTWNFLNFGKQPLKVLTKKFIHYSKKNLGKNLVIINEYTESKHFLCSPLTDKDVLSRMIKRAAIAAEEDAKKMSVFPADFHRKKLENTKKPPNKYSDKMFELTSLKPDLKEPNEGKETAPFRCQLLRSASNWSLGLNTIDNSIHNCYLEVIMSARHFIYIENRFLISNNANKNIKNLIMEALVIRIKRAAIHAEHFKVMIILPLVADLPGKLDENNDLLLLEQNIYKTICHGVNSLVEILKKDINIKYVSDYVSFYGLRTHDKIKGVPKTEEIYVNSNIMIIDDNIVVLGSANLNDRSLMGSRDAELALIVEDTKKIESMMAGNPVKVGQFSHNLRVRLFIEHFDLEQDKCRDPLDPMLQKMIMENCRKNTAYYREIFRVWPDDNVTRLDMWESFVKEKKISYYDMLIHKIKGHAVEFPLSWMMDEYLENDKSLVPVKMFF